MPTTLHVVLSQCEEVAAWGPFEIQERIVALGDAFEENVKACQRKLQKFASGDGRTQKLENNVDVPNERCFHGLDAYQKLLDLFSPGVAP